MMVTRFLSRHVWVPIGLLLVVAMFASAQVGSTPASSAKPKLEYLHQEVKSDAVVQTLNDLDKQGWEVFQVIPSWTIKNDNGETALTPTSYQLFGRRALGK